MKGLPNRSRCFSNRSYVSVRPSLAVLQVIHGSPPAYPAGIQESINKTAGHKWGIGRK